MTTFNTAGGFLSLGGLDDLQFFGIVNMRVITEYADGYAQSYDFYMPSNAWRTTFPLDFEEYNGVVDGHYHEPFVSFIGAANLLDAPWTYMTAIVTWGEDQDTFALLAQNTETDVEAFVPLAGAVIPAVTDLAGLTAFYTTITEIRPVSGSANLTETHGFQTETDRVVGTDGDEVLHLTGGNDQAFLLGGDDEVAMGDGVDRVYGQDGNDTLYGDDGGDYMFGGTGNDWLLGGTGYDRIKGMDGNDILEGGFDRDALRGGDGADTLLGQEGDDFLFGENGDDDLRGGDGDDAIYGGNDNDEMQGNDGNDTLRGGFGDDTIRGDDAAYDNVPGNDVLVGQDGDDVLSGDEGDDRLLGNAGLDTLSGGAGSDLIDGGAGDDVIYGAGFNESYDGDDTIYGRTGNDTIEAGNGMATIRGGWGDDSISAGWDGGIVYGENGNDTIDATMGDAHMVYGGRDDDMIRADVQANERYDLDSATYDGGTGVDTLVIDGGGIWYGEAEMLDDGSGFVVRNANGTVDTFLNFEHVLVEGFGDDTIMTVDEFREGYWSHVFV